MKDVSHWLVITFSVLGASACSDDGAVGGGGEGSGAGSNTAGGPAGAGGTGDGGGLEGGAGGGEPTGQCGPNLYNPLKNVYWGDLHVHTAYSVDSYAIANRNDPAAAYSFARGEATLPIAEAGGIGVRATIDQPLDFAAVTDHSEFFTLTGQCQLGEPGNEDLCADLADQGSGQQLVQLGLLGARLLQADPAALPGCVTPQGMQECIQAAQTTWQKSIEAAAAANTPCSFTSLLAYEWTASTAGANLHRNVIFGSDTVPAVPFDYINHPTSLELWQALDAECKLADGCDAITIPHNSNYSLGTMWDTADDDAVSREYMARYQSLTEVMQHKAASECIPGDSLSDADCDFEGVPGQDPAATGPGYSRNGLARGLMVEMSTGENPLAFGFVGATDTHNGTPGAVKEDEWSGHLGGTEDTPEERLNAAAARSPGGITAVWARENTRAEIFAAMKRRETYATSGPRITARFYVLDDVTDEDAAAYCLDPEFPKALVGAGAQPMGARVTGMVRPRLFVAGAAAETPLERFDIIRLGLDGGGQPAMTRFPVALQAGESATFCRSVNEDVTFDSSKPWLYYARIFEQPSARWVQSDCAVMPSHETCSDPTIAKTAQERAWTSAIFVSAR